VSVSAAQAAAFYKEALELGFVWTLKDSGGIPAPQTDEGRAMPFWSKASRAQKVIDNVPAYADFGVISVPLQEFRERWLPGMLRDGLRVGLNWSGAFATGYDLPPEDVERNLAAREGHA
jgi:hypothetical protein